MNPIDWYPWGQEAFARAEQLDIPIFLSIGYSACHWCHVMERECFEDAEVAGELNAHFVCIKVDREERPDVDEAYMAATQLMSGRGGWPLSAFLTPDRKPFFAGTYFPKHDRGRQPGLLSICTQLAHAWLHRREEVMSAANEITRGLERSLLGAVPASAELITQDGLDRGAIERVVEAWIEDYDPENGGFGKAPKFPPHTGMDFLSLFALRPDADEELCASALGIAVTTAYCMALGGIHDQVGGGFHRYSTDAEWKLPHFEKMLCDNALILANFSQILSIVHGTSPIAEAELERASRGILNWIEREMRADDGLIYSALDADSEGEEGRFYVWTEGELRESLGELATEFCSAYGVQSQGNFVDEASGRNMGVNVLFLRDAPSQPFDRELEILREVRSRRIPPATDDKCLVGWNGLAIEGFALAGAVDLALGAALAILTIEGSHGRLPRHITKSNPHGEGYLEDYAYFAQALIQLSALLSYAEQTGVADPNWPSSSTIRSHADRLVLEMVQKFYDDDEGGFFATSSHHERLFGPTKPVFDQPLPSGNAVAIRCLFEIGDRDRAIQSLCALSGWMERAPLATAALYSVCMRFLPYRDGALVEGESSLDRLPNPRQQVVIELNSKSLEANAEGVAKGVVNISIPPGLHLNSSQPIAKWLTPTRIEIVPLKAGIEYPPAVDEAYEGDLQIPFTVYLPTGVSGAEFELLISFQACTDQECLAPASRSFAGIVRRLAP